MPETAQGGVDPTHIAGHPDNLTQLPEESPVRSLGKFLSRKELPP
jgi:hypothetical protein